MRRILAALALAVAPLCALGQSNFLTITTANANEIADASGNGITGKFCAYATDQNDQPIAFRVATTYQSPRSTVCVNISAGQFSATYKLANPALTTPTNIRYHVIVTDTVRNTTTQYPSVQPTGGSSWDWSSYTPTPSSIPVIYIPTLNPRGVWSSLNTYAVSDWVNYNGSAYVSIIPNNVNNPGTPISPGTGWNLLAQVGANGTNCASGGSPGTCNFNGALIATSFSGSVNGSVALTTYSALGDCTRTGSTVSCTNNYTAFTNAIAGALPAHQALYLPVNPSATGETTYYVCPAIDTKGLSIYAQPGGWGLGSTGGYAYPVNIRGCASNDVIHINPATAYPTSTWEGFNVITDDSVDVSASNTTRRLGRQCHDVVANGTTVITSALQCRFQQGDVGQAITVGSLTGTVASVQSVNQATLSFSATSGTAVAAYISVLGLAVTQNIGNCGVAIEDATGASASLAPAVILRNVGFATTSNAGNHTCAWMTQGNAALYNSEFDYVNTAGATFGFMFIPSASGATNGTIYAGLGDRNRWVHNWLNNNYPFLAYDGGLDSLIDTQINGEIYGPTILNFDGVRQYPESWDIDLPEVESNGQHCTAGSNWFRLSGMRHTANRLYGPFCPETTSFIWDAAYSQASNVYLGSINALVVSGDQALLNLTGQLNSPASVSITGRGAKVTQCGQFSNFASTTPGRCAFFTQSPSRSAIAFDRSADFGRNAGTNDAGWYMSDEGLYLWPTEIGCSTCGYGPPLVADTTARTGQTVDTTGSSAFVVDEVNGTSLTISSSTVAGQFPAKKMRVYVRHKGSTSISGAYFLVASNGTNLCVNSTISLTTAWSVDTCDIDTTAYAGLTLQVRIGETGNANHIYTDYIRFRPNDDDTLTTKLTETLFTPASSSAACSAGQVAEDANYHYVCTATNTWKRVALTTF